MRRRNILGAENTINVTLSSMSTTVEPNRGSTTVIAYCNGVAITNGTSSMLTYDGTVISSCTINSSGVITMRYGRNTSTSSTKSGWMKFTYSGVTTQFNLTQRADYVYNTYNTSSSSATSYVESFININRYEVDCNMNGNYVTLFADYNGYNVTRTVVTQITVYKSGYQSSRQISDTTSTGQTTTFYNKQIHTKSKGMVLSVGQTSGKTISSSDVSSYYYYSSEKFAFNNNLAVTISVISSRGTCYESGCEECFNANVSWTYGTTTGATSNFTYALNCCIS